MLKAYKIVPWFNSSEWLKVYKKLFSDNVTQQSKQEALQCLLIWKARSPSLPAGVESTLSLLEVDLQDSNNVEINNSQLLRLAYSTAIMRFVNHMLDEESAKVNSLYKAAKKCGLPDWIVDLRHDTAHSNNLPSLELLREATSISLQWLCDNYWAKHKEVISDCVVDKKLVNKGDNMEKLNALLNFCISLSFSAHPKCNVQTIENIPNDLRECLISDAREIFGNKIDFSDLQKVSLRRLIDLTIAHTKKTFININSSHITKILLDQDSLFLSNELYGLMSKNTKYKALDKNYIKGFELLLKILSLTDCLMDFILGLIEVTENNVNDNNKRTLAARWVSELLNALRKSQKFTERVVSSNIDLESKKSNEILSLYLHWYPNEKSCPLLFNLEQPIPKSFTDINFLQPIISKYNPYLYYFIDDFLSLVRPQLPEHIIEKITTLAKLIALPDKFPMESTKIYDIDDLPNCKKSAIESVMQVDNEECIIIEEKQSQPEQSQPEVFGLWKKASKDHNWSSCPIGLLPWQQINQTGMDVD